MIYYLFLLAAFFELGVSQKSSPCPSVFTYESPNSAEPDRWYGILILRNREQLKGIWIEVTLDETAQLLGNWFGETSTTDYQEFTIRDMTYTLEADTPMSMRFFVKYDRRKSVPSVVAIRLNGRLICGERPQQAASTTRRPQSGISLSEQSGANRGTGSGSGSRGTSSTSTNTNNGGRGTSSSSNSGNRGTGTGASGTNSRPATTQSSRPSSGGRVTTKPRPSSNTLTDSSESNYNSNGNREPVYTSNSASTSNNNRNPENYGTSSSDNGNSYDNNGRDPDYGSNSNNNYNNNRPSGSSSSGSNNNRNPSFSGSNSGGGLSFAEDNNSEGDYFPGDFSVARPPAINRPSSSHKGNSGTSTIGIRQPRCGTVGVQPRPLITHAQGTTPGEWPWHVALYHSQGIQLKYICGGTLVSEKHIITAAHCVTKPSTTTTVGAENVLAYLGKYNLKKFGSEVQDREVSRIYIHPNYNSTYYFNDLAVLKLSEPVTMNNYVRASCLWEDESDLNSIVDQLGTVVGWGFDENKQISNELMKAEMPVVDTATCIYSNRDFFSQFTNEQTYCAGFRNGTSVCNGDSGGGMVFPKTHRDGSTTWQLRGVVSVGVALQGEPVCDSSHYIVFTDIAQHLEWIQEIMSQR